jgi:hypothetical protein
LSSLCSTVLARYWTALTIGAKIQASAPPAGVGCGGGWGGGGGGGGGGGVVDHPVCVGVLQLPRLP